MHSDAGQGWDGLGHLKGNSKLEMQSRPITMYLWIIAAIAVVLFILNFIGVFKSASTSNTCVAAQSYVCGSPELNTAGNLSVAVAQTTSSTITVTGVSCTNSTSPGPVNIVQLTSPITMGGNNQYPLTFECLNAAGAIGSSFSGQLWIQYSTQSGNGFIGRVGIFSAVVSTTRTLIVAPPVKPACPWTITNSIVVGLYPHSLALSGNGILYSANLGSGTVSVINTTKNTTVDTINGFASPDFIALGAGYAYVADSNSSSVSIINTMNNKVVNSIMVGDFPWAIALDGMGHAYVTNWYGSTVSVINTTTNTVTKIIATRSFPTGVAIENGLVYVTNLESGSVSVIPVSTNKVANVIGGFYSPYGIAFAQGGRYGYVTEWGNNTVAEISQSNNTIVGMITGLNNPYAIAFSGGRFAYVTNPVANTVSVINMTSDRVVHTITGFDYPYSIVVGKGYAYVSNAENSTISVVPLGIC